MRCARLLGPVLAVLAAALLVAPQAAAEPPFRLPGYLTDHTRALTDAQRTDVKYALDNEDWAGAAVAAANGLNTPGS